MATLRAVHGLNPGQIFPLEEDVAILGRHPDCHIVLESGSVSRRHAQVVRLGDDYCIEDLHSRNGTFLNGRLITSRQRLAEGDELGICDLTFVFNTAAPQLDTPSELDPEATPRTAALLVDDQPSAESRIMSKVDISFGSNGLQLEVNPAAKLKALMQIGQNVGRALGLGDVLPALLDSLFEIFAQADRGFVVLKDRQRDRLVPKAVKYRRGDDVETIRISRTIVNSVMANKEAILSADAASDVRFDMSESIVDFHIRSMMCAPLIDSDGVVLGVIQIDTLDHRKRFSREDLDLLASVACQAALAVENAELHETALRQQRLTRELAVAHEVQQGFLPTAAPKIASYRFFDHYNAADHLGGDYYDYVALPDGRLAVVVADVSGKGISASLLMAKLSSETRYCLAVQPTLADAIGQLNRVFCGDQWEDRFITMVACVLDPERHEVTIVNAGHMPPLLRRGAEIGTSGKSLIEAIGETETRLPLGVLDDVVYCEHILPLAPGDSLTLFTDGVTEAMNQSNDLYGNQRLCEQLQNPAADIDALGKALLADVKRFVGSRAPSDDLCLVCFGRDDS